MYYIYIYIHVFPRNMENPTDLLTDYNHKVIKEKYGVFSEPVQKKGLVIY